MNTTLKSTFSGYNAVADDMGLSSFVQLLLRPRTAKSHQILLKFELIQFKVVPGHWSWTLGVGRKYICSVLLVINSNFGHMFNNFRDIDTFSFKTACCHTHQCLMPPSGGTDNIICTSLKSIFSGLQFCRRHDRSIFIHLAVVAFQNHKKSQWDYMHRI